MTDLTKLGVAAIRDGVAAGDFQAVEVAEALNAQRRRRKDAQRLYRRNAGKGD